MARFTINIYSEFVKRTVLSEVSKIISEKEKKGKSMANLSKIRRDRMIDFLEQLKAEHTDDASIRAFYEIENQLMEKKYGLVWEEHSEAVDDMLKENIPILCADVDRRICKDKNAPWNFIIEGDNLQALYLLEKTHRERIDCIYIDPPYNTGAHDWKYNNNYVGAEDEYRHSMWLSLMKTRLLIAKRLLNLSNSVLICTIDEKEYLRLGCLLEELFPDAKIQMISTCINPAGASRQSEFSRTSEFIFFVKIGSASPIPLALEDSWAKNKKGYSDSKKGANWDSLLRSGPSSNRSDRPNMFYPIFVSEDGKKFIGAGDAIPLECDRNTVVAPMGQKIIWPIRSDGSEGRWRVGKDTLLKVQKNHFLKLGGFTKTGMAIYYLKTGEQQKVLNGTYITDGYLEDGAYKIIGIAERSTFVPGDIWNIPTHNASAYGSVLLKNIIGNRFSYPKSLYAVHDAIRFFVADKPDATILDFFSGSGTTGHAVNLLNAEDGGHRKFIMVTNNEISESEEKKLESEGVHKGDEQWEALGIAKYVTWPRTLCTIEGHDINNKTLKGEYFGSNIQMSEGFITNVKYFKCGWTPRKPEDYLLSNALCLHIKEMIELQNAIEIDDITNVLLLNKDDFKRVILNSEVYSNIENIWLNQNMILNAEELKMLNAKGYRYIPREFFGQELKEAAE